MVDTCVIDLCKRCKHRLGATALALSSISDDRHTKDAQFVESYGSVAKVEDSH